MPLPVSELNIPDLDPINSGADLATRYLEVSDAAGNSNKVDFPTLAQTVNNALPGANGLKSLVKSVKCYDTSSSQYYPGNSTLAGLDTSTLAVGTLCWVQFPLAGPAALYVLIADGSGNVGPVSYDGTFDSQKYLARWVDVNSLEAKVSEIADFNPFAAEYDKSDNVKFTLHGTIRLFEARQTLTKSSFSTNRIPEPTGSATDANWAEISAQPSPNDSTSGQIACRFHTIAESQADPYGGDSLEAVTLRNPYLYTYRTATVELGPGAGTYRVVYAPGAAREFDAYVDGSFAGGRNPSRWELVPAADVYKAYVDAADAALGMRIDANTAASQSQQNALTQHVADHANPHAVTAAQVGLGNVSNDAQLKRSELGAPNGVASLDADGKHLIGETPDVLLGNVRYRGTYSFATNTVTSNLSSINGGALPPATSSNTGWYLIAQDYGTLNSKDFEPGDWLISNGTAGWDKVDNTDAVKSVAGRKGIITLSTDDVSEGSQQYFTPARAQAALATQLAAKADLVSSKVPVAQLPVATSTKAGVVIPGNGLSVAADGTTKLSTIGALTLKIATPRGYASFTELVASGITNALTELNGGIYAPESNVTIYNDITGNTYAIYLSYGFYQFYTYGNLSNLSIETGGGSGRHVHKMYNIANYTSIYRNVTWNAPFIVSPGSTGQRMILDNCQFGPNSSMSVESAGQTITIVLRNGTIAPATINAGVTLVRENPNFTPTLIQSLVMRGPFVNGEYAGAAIAGSVYGMQFADRDFIYRYDLGNGDANNTTYKWLQTPKTATASATLDASTMTNGVLVASGTASSARYVTVTRSGAAFSVFQSFFLPTVRIYSDLANGGPISLTPGTATTSGALRFDKLYPGGMTFGTANDYIEFEKMTVGGTFNWFETNRKNY